LVSRFFGIETHPTLRDASLVGPASVVWHAVSRGA